MFYNKKEDEKLLKFRDRFDYWIKVQQEMEVSNNTLYKYQSNYTTFFKDSDFEMLLIEGKTKTGKT